jgi:DNA-nicking Smr family endonuclease
MKPRKSHRKPLPPPRENPDARQKADELLFQKSIESLSDEDIARHKPADADIDAVPGPKRTGNRILREIDLHGFTAEGAISYLEAELDHLQRRDGKVKIVVGKGNTSVAGIGVLRIVIPKWLDTLGAKYVATYKWASKRQGGSGAIIATLRGS